jgi:hypothetical protein
MKIPKYVWQYTTINRSQNFQPDCADVVFINTGSSNVIINGLLLEPGDSTTDPSFGIEYSNTNYSIVFGDTGTRNLVVKRKKYVGFMDFDFN